MVRRSALLSLAIAMSVAGLYGCEAEDEGTTLLNEGGTTTVTPTGEGGSGTGTATGEGGNTFNPEANPCSGHAGDIICLGSVAVTCDDDEEKASEQDCGTDICVPGEGCTLCIEGQFKCEGNEVLQCDVGPPLQWTTVTSCSPTSNQRCNPTLGACETMSPIGNGPGNPTGTYYQYARFLTTDGVFLGGYDVDSLGNYLYVNRQGQYVDVYAVELLDSDGDNEFEPNQHPDNPDDTGPMEERIITHVTTYTVAVGQASTSELYVASDRIFHVNRSSSAPNIFEFIMGSGTQNTVVAATGSQYFSHLGYDEINNKWYASVENPRTVYSYHEPSNSWVGEFTFPDLAGSHMDGLEVVVDPNSGTPYVYVSDMTSDYLGQYVRDRGGQWRQVNLFEYQGTGEYVEGMGFGALNHFWAAAGSAVYEIGGGDLQKFTEPYTPPR
jgi:hypothetical protein